MTYLDSCKIILKGQTASMSEQRAAEIDSIKSFRELAQLHFAAYGDMDGFIQLLDSARVLQSSTLHSDQNPSWAEGKKLEVTEFRFPYWDEGSVY